MKKSSQKVIVRSSNVEPSDSEKARRKLLRMSREKFDEMMCKRFPGIFADRGKPMNVTCMCWGFDVGPGWYPLMLDVCTKIEFICDSNGKLLTVVADQIKEKFGTLRFYWHTVGSKDSFDESEQTVANMTYEILSDVISHAENRSGNTCEECGEWGETVTICGWVSTLCKKHAEAREKKRAADMKRWEGKSKGPQGSDMLDVILGTTADQKPAGPAIVLQKKPIKLRRRKV